MSKIISYSDIRNRKRVKESTIDQMVDNNCTLYYKRLKENNTLENQINFLRECAKSPASATKHFNTIRGIVNESDNEAIKMCYRNEILPIITLNESVSLPDEVLDSIKKNKICDRIVENHYRIFKKEDIDSYVKKCLNNDPKGSTVLRKCCEAVSEHKLPIYGKVMVSLEEFFYLSGKYGIQYEDSDIVDRAVTYFMIKESFTENDINKLRKTLENNMIINYNTTGRMDFVSLFANSPVKNIDLLESIMNDIFVSNNFNIGEDVREFLRLLGEITCSSNDEALISGIVNNIIPKIYEMYYTNFIDNDKLSQITGSILLYIDKEIDTTTGIINIPREDSILTSRCEYYKSALINLKEKLKEIKDVVYTEYNLIQMRDRVNESADIITLEQYKLFKHENLLTVVGKIDKYIATKFKNINDTVRNKIKNIKKKIFSESSIYDTITCEGKVDYTITVIEMNEIDSSIHELLTEICKEINNYQINESGFRVYYMIECNSIKINVKSDTVIDLSDEEKEELDKYVPEEERSLIMDIVKYNNIEECNLFSDTDIVKFFSENRKDSEEMFSLFIELASYIGMSKENLISIFESIVSNRHNVKDFYIKNNYLVEGYIPTNNDLLIVVEAVNAISDMIYEDTKDNIKKKVKDVASNINLNNIKLVIEGLKKKAKDLSSKEQAASRQADATFNRFINSIKSTLISDRREAIIKGSVIPSFSKSIKIALGLVGLGLVTQNPVVPLVTAIGGLALSKKLTKKERALLLDEIEIELEMIEKEIQMAEGRNQMKKLRILMKTKKELQRQYQRIKYNIRVGKDLIPSSSGVPTRH